MLFSLALGVVLVILVFNWEKVRDGYQDRCSHYEVWGVIEDWGTASPVEGARVISGRQKTYSNWEGAFFLYQLHSGDPVALELPVGYEPYLPPSPVYEAYTQRLTCQRVVHQRYQPVAGSRLTLERILAAQVNRNYDYLWALMASEGQSFWADQKVTNAVLAARDQIWDRLGLAWEGYEILADGEELAAWRYPLTSEEFEGVQVFKARQVQANGEEALINWYLVKEGGFWHYLPLESQKMVDDYIKEKSYLLNKKL